MRVTQSSGIEPGSKQLRTSARMLEVKHSEKTGYAPHPCQAAFIHIDTRYSSAPECKKDDPVNLYCSGAHSELAFNAAHNELLRRHSILLSRFERFEVSCSLADLHSRRFARHAHIEQVAQYLAQALNDLGNAPGPGAWPRQVEWARTVIRLWHLTQHPDTNEPQLLSAFEYLREAIAVPQVPPQIRITHIMAWLGVAHGLPLREALWGRDNMRLMEQIVDMCELALSCLEEYSWMASNIHWSIYNRQYRFHENIETVLIRFIWRAIQRIGGEPQSPLMGKAFEVFDATQALVWGQLARLRVPLGELERVDIGLASRLQSVSAKLERHWGLGANGTDPEDSILGLRAWRYWHERNAILERIRRLPGFEEFLKAKSFRELREVDKEGPVVLLFSQPDRAEAIVFAATPYPDLRGLHPHDHFIGHTCLSVSQAAVKNLHIALTCWANSRSGDPSTSTDTQPQDRAGRPRPSGTSSVEDVLEILWKKVAKPVLDLIMNERGKGKSKAWSVPERGLRQRIWWCCLGEFSFLPIHAAGIYRGDSPICVSDFFLSSYTPSLGALIDSRKRSIPANIKVLAAAQPDPGSPWSKLPDTREELHEIVKAVPPSNLICLGNNNQPDFDGEHTTVENVLAKLADASILHLACHGEQSRNYPLNSGFILRGGERLTILDLMRCRLPNAHAAILSACHTASNDPVQPGEFVNLASALLFLGFRSIIATKWPMGDDDGPLIARAVYRTLFPLNNGIGAAQHGRDLSMLDLPKIIDDLARDLSSKGVSARRWATFVHIGA